MPTTQTKVVSRYKAVEEYIERLIQSGGLNVGDKLPSIRATSSKLGVAKNTVIRAYQELEAVGKITARDRSGFVVHRSFLNSLAPFSISAQIDTVPTTVDLLSMTKQILGQSPGTLLMPAGSAHPNTEGPAISSLYAEIGRHSRAQSHIPSHYQLPPGNEKLLKQIAKISIDQGIELQGESVFVTNGSQQAISQALRAVTKPGDTIAVESPCYFGILLMLESLGLKALEIPSSSEFGLHVPSLQSALTQWPVAAIVVTPNYTNPTGALMPLDARRQLLKSSGNIPIIEDDVFGALGNNAAIPSLKQLDTQKRVIYCTSLSKTLDSRLRIGWLIAGQYRHHIERSLISDNMGSQNLIQSAVGEFLATGKYKQHVRRMTRYYQNNLTHFIALLRQRLDSHFHDQYSLTSPTGSFLCWLTLPTHYDSQRIYDQCLIQGVSVLPGTLFGSKGQYAHCLRFNVANFHDNRAWRTGIDRFVTILEQQREHFKTRSDNEH
ncbi:PLP-dependent aminotransferase family protein [Vibrio nomapromontoriensis]|uniref:aminotransferase-like domain-containing protein n=1 Tax=Vibrio nomapromontoriensis TaxID=2910246 RepID=UPI003D13B39B